MFIYILELTNRKYYIGKTNNPDFRIQEHLDGSGSLWTKKFKPINLIELIKTEDSFDEDKYTLKYMEKYGIDNVRGGSFCEEKLSQDNIKTILKMINGSTDKCYICGEKGHFANKCSLQLQYQIDNIKNLLKKSFSKNCYISNYDSSSNSSVYSYSSSNSSINSYDLVWSCDYCGKQFDTKKGCTFHENIHCKKKYSKTYTTYSYKKNTNKKSYTKQKSQSCYRCGRQGHYADCCYASKHINGYYIN